MLDFICSFILQCFEGIPPAYQKVKRVVCPDAFRVTRLRPGRKYTVLGDLAKRVGLKYEEIINKIEKKRNAKGAAYYAEKKVNIVLRKKAAEEAAKNEAVKKVLPTIQAFSF